MSLFRTFQRTNKKLIEYLERQVSRFKLASSLRNATTIREISAPANWPGVDDKGNLPGLYEAQDFAQAGHHCSNVEALAIGIRNSAST
jgi:hypothetical protein